MKVACVVLLSLALTGALAQDGVCNCYGTTPCKHNDNGTCIQRVNEAGQDVVTGGVCTAGSTDCTDLLDGSTAFDSPATRKQENEGGHVNTDTVFGPGDTAPKCFYDPVKKHTYVHFTTALHPSFKCHHVDASGEKATHSDATHCKCTATHPTHHAGGCMQLGDLAGGVHTLGGVCSEYGHSGHKDYSRTTHAHNGAAAGETLTDVTVVQKLKVDGMTAATFDAAAQLGVRRAVAKQLDGVESDQVGISNIRAVFAASRRRLAESAPTNTLCAPTENRLFKTAQGSTPTLQACKDLCTATANCNVVSYGVSGNYVKGCIGCADTAASYADSRFETYTADGAVTFDVSVELFVAETVAAAQSTLTAIATGATGFSPTASGTSSSTLCAPQGYRLFQKVQGSTPTLQACKNLCAATTNCKAISYGIHSGSYAKGCIGCADTAGSYADSRFETYTTAAM
eukprot:g7300.t1